MMGKTAKRRTTFYVIVDPKARKVWAGGFDPPTFVPYGDLTATEFPNSREAWLTVRDIFLRNAEDPQLPDALEVRKMIRADTVAETKRIRRDDAGVALLMRIAAKKQGELYRSVRWLLTRADWERWKFAIHILDEEVDEEALAAICEQLTVDAIYVEPHIYTEDFKSAVAIKMALEGAVEIMELP